MGTDHAWAAVYEVVLEALLRDVAIQDRPPSSEQEVGFVAETLADHLIGAFIVARRDGTPLKR